MDKAAVVLCVSVPLWLFAVVGCRHVALPGENELPPGIVRLPGIFQDIGPRWCHDAKRIAFLRATTDRKYQLCVADSDLSNITPILDPEVINPDRPFRPGRAGWRAPEQIAWSPDDTRIAFSRVEWFTFPDGEKLPGTAIWQCDLRTREVTALAIHPPKYTGEFFFYRSPAWSPDGKRIAFIGEGLHGQTALFVRELAGTKPEIESPRYDQYADVDWPVWSPDGRFLAFRQGILRSSSADPIETIRIIEPGGREARRVWATTPRRFFHLRHSTMTADESDERFEDIGRAWSPHVAGIAYSLDGRNLAASAAYDVNDARTYVVITLPLAPPSGAIVHPKSGSADLQGYFAPQWHATDLLIALRAASEPLNYDAVLIPVGQQSEDRALHLLASLPSDDFDWSPDHRQIICAPPADARSRPESSTTLRIVPTGL